MTQPMNASLLRARQFVPQFAGTMPDAGVAQAHAMIAIGELLQQILMEMQQSRLAAEQAAQRMANREQSQRRSRSGQITLE